MNTIHPSSSRNSACQVQQTCGSESNRCRARISRPIFRLTACVLFTGGIAAGPATQPANLPPTVTAPLVLPKSTVAPVPYRPVLPPARAPHEPRVARSDGQHALRSRPAVDVPPLADSSTDLPAAPTLDAGPPVRVIASDPSALPVATIAARPDNGSATFATDLTLELATPGALVFFAPPRIIPPPPLLLPIPDPSHQAGAIATAPQADDGAPASNLERPAPTTLPVTR
jgi:hypothetical protein